MSRSSPVRPGPLLRCPEFRELVKYFLARPNLFVGEAESHLSDADRDRRRHIRGGRFLPPPRRNAIHATHVAPSAIARHDHDSGTSHRGKVMRDRPEFNVHEYFQEGSNDIGRLLAESRELLDRAVTEHRRQRPGAADIERFDPNPNFSQEIGDLLGRVRSEAVLAVSSPMRHQGYYQVVQLAVRDLLTTGRQVRLLYSPEYLAARDHRPLLDNSGLGAQIRVANSRFHNTFIIDRRVAVLWNSDGIGEPSAFMVREPLLLRTIYQFAMMTWKFAPRLTTYFDSGRDELDERSLAVLEALNSGLTDEAAARKLSVSLRTYHRYVAGLMSRFGATTRFQIGARAADLGLLSEGSSLQIPAIVAAAG